MSMKMVSLALEFETPKKKMFMIKLISNLILTIYIYENLTVIDFVKEMTKLNMIFLFTGLSFFVGTNPYISS